MERQRSEAKTEEDKFRKSEGGTQAKARIQEGGEELETNTNKTDAGTTPRTRRRNRPSAMAVDLSTVVQANAKIVDLPTMF